MRPFRYALLTLLATAALLAGWPAPGAYAAVLISHRAAISQLAAAGLTWTSSGGCSDRDDPDCTSFERIRQTTIDGVITLKTASGCPILVTGGTENGHGYGTYTHWNGWKVDIARWSCVGAYIAGNFAYVGYISGWGHQYRAPSGNLYTDEGDHWDILYYTCGGCSPHPTAPPSPVTMPPSPSPTPSPIDSPSPDTTASPDASTSPGADASPGTDTGMPPGTDASPSPDADASPSSVTGADASPGPGVAPSDAAASPVPEASLAAPGLPVPTTEPVLPSVRRIEPEPAGPPVVEPDRIEEHRG